MEDTNDYGHPLERPGMGVVVIPGAMVAVLGLFNSLSSFYDKSGVIPEL